MVWNVAKEMAKKMCAEKKEIGQNRVMNRWFYSFYLFDWSAGGKSFENFQRLVYFSTIATVSSDRIYMGHWLKLN